MPSNKESHSANNVQFSYPEAMEVNLAPELQAKIQQLVIETGCPVEKLIEEPLAGYVADLEQTREMLDGGYDDLKCGRVKPVSRDELVAHFREKSAAARSTPQGS